jgi:hypothetical protein
MRKPLFKIQSIAYCIVKIPYIQFLCALIFFSIYHKTILQTKLFYDASAEEHQTKVSSQNEKSDSPLKLEQIKVVFHNPSEEHLTIDFVFPASIELDNTQVKAFALKNPERIVADISLKNISTPFVVSSRTVKSNAESELKLIRMGVNTQNIRIVADIVENRIKLQQHHFEKGKLTLIFERLTKQQPLASQSSQAVSSGEKESSSQSKSNKEENSTVEQDKKSILSHEQEDSLKRKPSLDSSEEHAASSISLRKKIHQEEDTATLDFPEKEEVKVDESVKKEPHQHKTDPSHNKLQPENTDPDAEKHSVKSDDISVPKKKVSSAGLIPQQDTAVTAVPSQRQEVSEGRSLKQIALIYLAPTKTPAIKLLLSERASFSLDKQDNKSFILFLPEYVLASESLSLPHFPPTDFEGFTSVSAKNTPKGVEVLISVDENIRILAFPLGNEIIIRASTK